MKSEKWHTVPIKSVYQGLYDGPHATPAPCEDGPIFLGIKNITDDGALNLTEIRHINEADLPRWTKRVNPQPGDIVFTYEATLNRYAIIPQGFRGCLGRRMALIRVDPEKTDPRFLHLYFFSKQWREVISNNIWSGATVDRIPLIKFPDFPVTIPDLPTQRKIAGILSAYDDLIENNLRRIKILEEMAQSLYREWFVHFRFPGHESAKMVDSALGPIPEGWDWINLNELGYVGRGRSRHRPRNDPGLYGGDYPFFQTGDIKAAQTFLWSNSQTYSEAGLAQSKLWEEGTLCITIAANIADTAILAKRACFPDSVVGFVPDAGIGKAFFVMMFLNTLKDHIQNVSRGTTQDNLSLEKLLGFKILRPSSDVSSRFEESVTRLFSQQLALIKKNETLRRTRDLLRPKLLTDQH